jgi:hypothetical protein
MRRPRRRAGGRPASGGQAATVQRHIRAAITLLDWLTGGGLDLATARRGDLGTWLASSHAARSAGGVAAVPFQVKLVL